MRINCGLLVALLSMSAGGLEAQVPANAKSAPIFDGKTFAGWEGNLKIFRIDEGAIVGGTLKEKIARNEFLCTTRPYSDFELRLKVKLLGGDGANAGIQFRTREFPIITKCLDTRRTWALAGGARSTMSPDARRSCSGPIRPR